MAVAPGCRPGHPWEEGAAVPRPPLATWRIVVVPEGSPAEGDHAQACALRLVARWIRDAATSTPFAPHQGNTPPTAPPR